MDELTVLFAAVDPARTPADTPLPPEADALLREITSTPRGPGRLRQILIPGLPRNRSKPMALLAGAGAMSLVIGLVLVTGVWKPLMAGVPLAADYPWYATEKELVIAADTIIRGEIEAQRSEQLYGIDYTIATVRIDAVAKGPLRTGDQLDVKHPAAEPISFGLDPGDRVVLFLVLFSDAPASLVNPEQGSYLITDSTVIRATDDNPVELSRELLAGLGIPG